MRQRRSDGSLGLITLRFPPPLSGGAQKTGWEALDKWVGGGGGSGGEAAAARGIAPRDLIKTLVVRRGGRQLVSALNRSREMRSARRRITA